MTNYGYDLPVVISGRDLYNAAYGLQQNQKKEYGEKYGAVDIFGQAEMDTFDKYLGNWWVLHVSFLNATVIF